MASSKTEKLPANKREFITRSLTGILIVGITLGAIIYSPFTYLLFISIIGFFGTREYLKLDLDSPGPVILNGIPLFFSVLILAAGYVLIRLQNPMILLILVPVMISLVVLIQLLSINGPESLVKKGKSVYSAASYIVIPLLCGTLFLMNDYSYRYVLVPVILIWVNDVGAYLFGSKWGKTKIMPSISPGKSMQGTIGGGLVTLLVAFVLWKVWPDISLPYLITLAIATPFFAIAGDLWESALKRNAGVKDSGSILPGHGGIMDRYDSLLFVLPVAALAYYIFVL